MYPVLKEGVSLGTFRYEGSDDVHYYAENADGDEYEISFSLWNALDRADGTGPLALPDGGKRILPTLKERGLVRTSRFVEDEGLYNRFILFPVGNCSARAVRACRVMNRLLPLAAFVALTIGVNMIASGRFAIGGGLNLWLYYVLVIASLALHETGHLIAGLGYGYEISDVGILLLGILPFGAYVAHAEKESASKTEKIQFSLAGIEMNLLTAGLCLVLSAAWYPLSFTMVSVAVINILLAGLNLLPTSGLDGESVLSTLCGVDCIGEEAVKILRDRKCRRALLHSGRAGALRLCACAASLVSRVLFWGAVGANVILAVLQYSEII